MRPPVLVTFPRIQCFAATLIFTLIIVPTILAQSQITTGTIQGSVVDANSAAVPGANVVIKNLDTNAIRNLTTDDEGRFGALGLQPGNYSITVSKQGFGTAELQKTA